MPYVCKKITLEIKYMSSRILIIKHKLNFAPTDIWEKACLMEQGILVLLFTCKMQRITWITVHKDGLTVIGVMSNILL